MTVRGRRLGWARRQSTLQHLRRRSSVLGVLHIIQVADQLRHALAPQLLVAPAARCHRGAGGAGRGRDEVSWRRRPRTALTSISGHHWSEKSSVSTPQVSPGGHSRRVRELTPRSNRKNVFDCLFERTWTGNQTRRQFEGAGSFSEAMSWQRAPPSRCAATHLPSERVGNYIHTHAGVPLERNLLIIGTKGSVGRRRRGAKRRASDSTTKSRCLRLCRGGQILEQQVRACVGKGRIQGRTYESGKHCK